MKKIILLFLLLLCPLNANATPDSCWSTDMNSRWATIESNNPAWWQTAKANRNIVGGFQNGVINTIMYAISCNTSCNNTYAQDAYARIQTGNFGDRNKTRDTNVINAWIFSVIYPGLTTQQKADFEALLDNTNFEWVTAQDGGGHYTRFGDSDELIGHYFGLALYAVVVKNHNPTKYSNMLNYYGNFCFDCGGSVNEFVGGLAAGGLPPAGSNASTWKSMRFYVEILGDIFTEGGGWIEGNNYGMGTMSYAGLAIECINRLEGVDYYPKFTSAFDENANYLVNMYTPDFLTYIRFGNTENSGKQYGLLSHATAWTTSLYADLADNATLRYISDNKYSKSVSSVRHESFINIDPYGAESAPTGVTSHNSSDLGVSFWHSGWNPNDSMFFLLALRWTQFDHAHSIFTNAEIYRQGGYALYSPKDYFGNDNHATGLRHGVLVNGAFPNNNSEALGQISHRFGSNYSYMLGGAGGHQTYQRWTYASGMPPEFLKEYLAHRLAIHNSDGSDTLIFFDRFYASDPTAAIGNSKYTTARNFFNLYNGNHAFNLHIGDSTPSVSGNKYSFTARNGITAHFYTHIPFVQDSGSAGEQDDLGYYVKPQSFFLNNYPGYGLDSEYKNAIQFRVSKSNTFNNWVNVFHQGTSDLDVEAEVSSSVGSSEAAKGAYYEEGTNRVLAMFSAKSVTYPAATTTSEYDREKLAKIAALRILTQGYTLSRSFTGNITAYFADLDPTLSWFYKVDGGTGVALTVDSSALAVASISLSSGTHSIQVYADGQATQDCDDSPDLCADESTCEAATWCWEDRGSGADCYETCEAQDCDDVCGLCVGESACNGSAQTCYYYNATCNSTPQETCSPSRLDLCLTEIDCTSAGAAYWCDDDGDSIYICKATECDPPPSEMLFWADTGILAGYDCNEESGDLLDRATEDATSNDGTLVNATRADGNCIFDGTGDYVTIPDDAELNTGADDFTIYWEGSFDSTSGTQELFQHGNNGSGGKRVQAYYSGGTLTFGIDDDSSPTAFRFAQASFNPSIGERHKLFFIRTSGELRIYSNNSQIATGTDEIGGSLYDYNERPFILGASCDPAACPSTTSPFSFTGKIDSFVLFDRPLSADHRQQIVNADGFPEFEDTPPDVITEKKIIRTGTGGGFLSPGSF